MLKNNRLPVKVANTWWRNDLFVLFKLFVINLKGPCTSVKLQTFLRNSIQIWTFWICVSLKTFVKCSFVMLWYQNIILWLKSHVEIHHIPYHPPTQTWRQGLRNWDLFSSHSRGLAMIILQQNIQNTPRPKQGNWEIVWIYFILRRSEIRGQITWSKQPRNFNLQI